MMAIDIIDIVVSSSGDLGDMVINSDEFFQSKDKVKYITSPPLDDREFQEVASNINKLCNLPPFGNDVGCRHIQIVIPNTKELTLKNIHYYVDDQLRVTHIEPGSNATVRSGKYLGSKLYTHEQIKEL